jgi:hypothetical protein
MLLVRYLACALICTTAHAEISFFTPPQQQTHPPAELLRRHFETPKTEVVVKPVKAELVEAPALVDETAGCNDLGKAAAGLFSVKFIGAPLPQNELVQSLNNEFNFWKFKTPSEARGFITELCNKTGLTTTAFRP